MLRFYRYYRILPYLTIYFTASLVQVPVNAAKYDGQLTLSVVDQDTGQPLAARLQLRSGRNRPVRIRQKDAVSQGDIVAFDGQLTLELRTGSYQFSIDAGPEFHTRQGHFVIDRNAEDTKQITLARKVNMQQEGWWAGDLDVQQRLDDTRLLMQAAHLDYVPLLTQQNIGGKCKVLKDRSGGQPSELTAPIFGPWAALDRRRGGGLLLLGQATSLDLCELKADASSMSLLDNFSIPKGHVVALTPFAWDLPLWLAAGKLDAIQIIHRHALQNGTVDNEAWGKPRDRTFFPGKQGNGRWSEAIYQHVLNCGLRIPPAAGSGTGANKNPVGTNRMYVHCDEQFSQAAWWEGLRSGHVLVTNGPLLRVNVEGHPPGHVFELEKNESRDFQIGLSLTFYTESPVEYLEIVKNGRVAHEVRLDDLAKQQGRLPVLQFDRSGWFLVRAVTNSTETYKLASTGPYYVESYEGPRISRASAQFFLDWLDELVKEFADNRAVQADINAARPFWQDLLDRANAE